ncbi:unnamed protein product, partial [Phaeothamnion confervicola]
PPLPSSQPRSFAWADAAAPRSPEPPRWAAEVVRAARNRTSPPPSPSLPGLAAVRAQDRTPPVSPGAGNAGVLGSASPGTRRSPTPSGLGRGFRPVSVRALQGMASQRLSAAAGAPAAPSAAPPGFFLGWRSAGTQIWSRLRMAGLDVERLYGLDRRQVLLKIHLPRARLEAVAEKLRIRIRRHDGTVARFRIEHRNSFIGGGVHGDLFRVAESQRIIDHIVRTKIKDGGAELDERTTLGRSIVKRMPLHNATRLAELYGLWVVYWQPKPPPAATAARTAYGAHSGPLGHSNHIPGTYSGGAGGRGNAGGGTGGGNGGGGGNGRGGIMGLAVTGRAMVAGCLSQPLELVAEYFGEAVAFYFAWMAFYTRWLLLPSVVGVVFFGLQMHSGNLDHPAGPLYSLFIMGWASAFLVSWRQRCSELSYRWGVLDFEAEEQLRPQFVGRKRRDDITGEFVPYYPRWRRWLVYCFTGPAVVCFVLGVLLLMLLVFTTRDRALGTAAVNVDASVGVGGAGTATAAGGSDYASWGFWLVLLVLPSLYGIAIPILYQGCKRIGLWLTRLENYETESKYRNALILKVFSFRFVTVFASMYYYAFISQAGGANWKMLRLLASLLSFMTVGQWWYMAWMTYVPALLHRLSLQKLRRSVADERRRLENG